MKKTLLLTALMALSASVLSVQAAGTLSVKEKAEKAVKLKYRTEEEKERDWNRNPVGAIEFMGLKDDMKVIEFGPGGGWYTKILGPILKEKGQLIIAYKEEWMKDLDKILKTKHLKHVKKVGIDGMDWNGPKKEFSFKGVDFKTTDADMFLSIREYHNLPEDDRATFNNAVFRALKPGGSYIVIDHTRRHMEPSNEENWRRDDPVTVIKEVLDAGFTFTKHSNMFYRADDELRYELHRRSVRGNTDRFFFVFHKPK